MSNLRTITVVSTKNGRITKFSQDLESKEITVIATGKDNKTLNSDVVIKTWGELQDVLSSEGYDLSNLKPTENINKTTLEHNDAALPEGDFRLFLRPSKTKSGNNYASMGFKDLRSKINELGEDAKKHLSSLIPGKNWTQLTTQELRDGLSTFDTPSSSVKEVKGETASVEEVSSSSDVATPTTNIEKLQQAKSLLNCVKDNTSCSDLEEYADEAIDSIQNAIDLIELDGCDDEIISNEVPESEEEKAARQEEEDIKREMRELEEGF